MFYIDALMLVHLCVEHGILRTENGRIFVYRLAGTTEPEGWYLINENALAQELRSDKDARDVLMAAIKLKGLEFTPQFPCH